MSDAAAKVAFGEKMRDVQGVYISVRVLWVDRTSYSWPTDSRLKSIDSQQVSVRAF